MQQSNWQTERRTVMAVIAAAMVLGTIFGVKAWKTRRAQEARAGHGPFSMDVTVAPVTKMPWQSEIRAVMSLVPIEGVHLTPQLSGQVTGIYFDSSEQVRKGQRLVQIDNSNQLASLASDRAAENLARINYQRTVHLFRLQAASRASVDTARATLESAKAAVENDRATLGKMLVRAPFSGWMGIRKVSLGQYLSPGAEIASLNTWNPLRAEFTVPQGQIDLIHPKQKVTIAINTFPGRNFPGRITGVGSEIDSSTRNLAVEATIPNPQLLFRPGMFGVVHVMVGAPVQVLVVPTVAMTYNTFGDYVYVVQSRVMGGHPMQVAIATPVHTGQTRGSVTEILSGLHAGELVVTAGQVKLRSGMPVTAHRAVSH